MDDSKENPKVKIVKIWSIYWKESINKLGVTTDSRFMVIITYI